MQMVKETKQLNDKMIAEAKQQAKVEAQQIIDSAREQIAKEKAQAIAEIRSEVAALSIGMAEKILRQELNDKKAQEQYIERLLKESVSAS
jgi:F-type H+-transporting ATPase subunit b